MGCVCCRLDGDNLTQLFEDVFDSLFQRRERVAPSDVQGAVPPTPTSPNNGLVLGRAEVPTHLHKKSEPLRSENVTDAESTDRKENIDGSKACFSESSLKLQSAQMTVGCSLSEDEDVCPICLEEYTYENPRVDMQCTHQYHLGCIYEWMERSQNCPFCSKVISFSKW
nr:PREDICTED: E3 ubiquitin-protein ligase At3g02290-like isoform X2 [Musa acuminata subsp. malaccensis]